MIRVCSKIGLDLRVLPGLLVLSSALAMAQYTPPGGGTGGNATTINGAAVPSGAPCLGSNSNSGPQLITVACGFTYLGTYSGSVTYAINQVVSDGSGQTFVSLASGNTGNALPSQPTLSNSYWRYLGGPVTSLNGYIASNAPQLTGYFNWIDGSGNTLASTAANAASTNYANLSSGATLSQDGNLANANIPLSATNTFKSAGYNGIWSTLVDRWYNTSTSVAHFNQWNINDFVSSYTTTPTTLLRNHFCTSDVTCLPISETFSYPAGSTVYENGLAWRSTTALYLVQSNLSNAAFYPSTGYTVACTSASKCTPLAGSVTIAGSAGAATGNIVTLGWSGQGSTPNCLVAPNGNSTFLALGHTNPTNGGFTITTGTSLVGLTVVVDYQCQY